MMEIEDDSLTNVNNSNNQLPISIDSEIRLPLDNSMRILFTGYFNGFSVEVRSVDEIALLYHMGCFGKGSTSRSRPQKDESPAIMRERQYNKRAFWCKKFCGTPQRSEADAFLKEINELTAKFTSDGENQRRKGVIDLVSSDEDVDDSMTDAVNEQLQTSVNDDRYRNNIVVTVPDSDSEGENYFENLKPKCCVNQVKIQEKLILSLQEAFFLAFGLGCLQIHNLENKLINLDECWKLFTECDYSFVHKYVVYHYFRSKGYVVKSGLKFGGDYLLYKDGPGMAHAQFIVIIREEGNEHTFNWTSMLGHIRMAATTVKEILVAEITKKTNSKELPTFQEVLTHHSVREIVINRNIPVTINEDVD